MQWVQEYNPLGNILLSAFVAAIPLCILFYMFVLQQIKGHVAAFAATGTAILLAVVFWNMPVGLALDATAYGAAFGIFPIIWIVVTAIWVYNMTVESGKFEIIKNSLACITEDRRLQAIFITFAFGSFIEGTTVATAAAKLVGHEGDLFRFTLIHSIAMVLIMSAFTLLQAYMLRGMLP